MQEEKDYYKEVYELAKDLDRGDNKEVACPKCGAKLHIQKSALNGHLFVKCEKPGCIYFME